MSIVLFGLLSILSVAMTPSWKVRPYAQHLRINSADTSFSARGVSPTPEGTYKVKTTDITFTISDGKTTHAIVREPLGAPTDHPACVFVHGAGTGKAKEVYADLASALASSGITTLVQDKRLDNYTALSRDYQSNAVDYEAGLNTLRRWPGVDAAKTGLYAESEGTWIAMIMAKQDPHIAFEILTSPPVVSPRSQIAMAATEYLNVAGVPNSLYSIVPKITSMNFGWLGLNYANFSPEPYYSSLTMPLLVNYGTLDPSMPIEQGAQILIDEAAAVGNTNVGVRYYPTNHQMRTGSSRALPNLPLEPHYTHNLEDWVHIVSSGASADAWTSPMIAGDQPFQEYKAPKHITPGLIRNINVIIIFVAICLIAWVVAALASLGLVVVNGLRAARMRRARKLYDDACAIHDEALEAQYAREFTRLPHPTRFSGITGTLIVTNVLMALVMIIGCAGYLNLMSTSALRLNDDNAGMLNLGWSLLRLGAIASIVLLSWMWDRILLNKTRFHFKDEPVHQPKRMMPGHWIVIVAATICMLAMLFFATFLGVLSF